MKSTFNMLTAVLMLSAPCLAATAADNPQFDLLKDMSVADYRATGLDKLSDAQIKALSAWFANYENQHAKDCAKTAAIAPVAMPAATTSVAARPAGAASKSHKVDGSVVTTSRLQGKFSGWDGDTVFKLQNGQTWEQTDQSILTIAAMHNPQIIVTRGAFNVYYLHVKGLTDSVQVRKVEAGDSNQN